MESTPNPIPPVEVQGNEHGELPVNDPPPSDQPEEHSPVEEPEGPEGDNEKKRKASRNIDIDRESMPLP